MGGLENLTGNMPLGKPRRRWERNIIIDRLEIVLNVKNFRFTVDGCTFVNEALSFRIL